MAFTPIDPLSAVTKTDLEEGTDPRTWDIQPHKDLQKTADKIKSEQVKPTTTGKFTPVKSESKAGGFTPLAKAHSAGETFAKEAAVSGIEAVGSLPAMVFGAQLGAEAGTAVAPGLGTVVGGAIGGIAGGIAGQKSMEALGSLIPEDLKEKVGLGSKERAEAAQQHPEAAFAGGLAGSLAVMRPGSIKAIEYAKGKFISANQQRAAMAGISAGMETANQALSDQPFDWAHVAAAGAWGSVAAKPTKITEKLGGLFRERTVYTDPGNNEWTKKRKQWDPPKVIVVPGDDIPAHMTKSGKPEPGVREIPVKVGPTGNLTSKGTPELARNFGDHIVLDMDSIKARFEKDPRHYVAEGHEGVTFKSPEEMAHYVLAHEEYHSITSYEDWLKKTVPTTTADARGVEKQYEQAANLYALDKVQKNPLIHEPDPNVPEMPKTDIEMSDTLFRLTNNEVSDRVLASQRIKYYEKEHGIEQKDWEAVRKHVETGGKTPLDEKQRNLYEEGMKAELDELRDINRYLMEEGVIDKVPMEDNHFPRRMQRKPQTRWEQAKEKLGFGATKPGGFDMNIERTASGAEQRAIFQAELPNGKRVVIQDIGDKYIQWNNGKATLFARKATQFKIGDKIGNYTIKEAPIEDIEKNSPYRYEKNSQSVLYDKLIEARRQLRAHEFMKQFKGTDYFKENSQKVDPQKGYQQEKDGREFYVPNLDKMPGLQGYAFERRLADALEDFNKTWDPTMLTKVSGALVKNMMLNPIPHIFNESMHLYNTRGLSGWVSPAGIKRFVTTSLPAIKDVALMGPNYREVLRNGGQLLSADLRAAAEMKEYFNSAKPEILADRNFIEMAKDLGMKPLEWYDRLSNASNKAMWVVRDSMYVQLINEKMKYGGMDMKQAIAEVDKHMPNYRLPTHVGESVLGQNMSRSLSKILQNPNVSIFSRYHFGMLRSLIETGKDVAAIRKGKAGLEEFKHGVDSMAAIAVASAILYPLMDVIAQQMTGNENATQRRAGPYHLGHAIMEVAEGTKQPQAALSAVFTANPALLGLIQLAVDRNLYSGQPIYHPTDDPELIAKDVGKYLLNSLPQFSTLSKTQGNDDEFGIVPWLAKQIDIEAPSEKQAERREKQRHKEQVASEHRKEKADE